MFSERNLSAHKKLHVELFHFKPQCDSDVSLVNESTLWASSFRTGIIVNSDILEMIRFNIIPLINLGNTVYEHTYQPGSAELWKS